jgi:ribosome-associated toxin RatA of RatAB toxin-antitoxin module
MRQVRRSALVAVPRELMFEIINDVESYPEFVPWCHHAEVLSRGESEITATLHIRKGLLRTHFTTRNTLSRPHSVRLSLVEGSFRRFAGEWTLEPIADPDGRPMGCRVSLELTFELSGALAGALFEGVFEHAAATLMDAFVARARTQRGVARAEAAVADAGAGAPMARPAPQR